MQKRPSRSFFALLLSLLVFSAAPVRAATDITTFTGDLNNLILQGNSLVVTTNATTLSTLTMSTKLASLAYSYSSYLSTVQSVYDSLAGSSNLMLTDEALVALQTLSSVTVTLSQGVFTLSAKVVSLSASTPLSILDPSLASMLQLSNDIGTMADRIGEMADRILVMADNIGIMADRIIATQLIQNTNIALVVNATLETQKNTITLLSLYNL